MKRLPAVWFGSELSQFEALRRVDSSQSDQAFGNQQAVGDEGGPDRPWTSPRLATDHLADGVQGVHVPSTPGSDAPDPAVHPVQYPDFGQALQAPSCPPGCRFAVTKMQSLQVPASGHFHCLEGGDDLAIDVA
jgi:hypothetical protein